MNSTLLSGGRVNPQVHGSVNRDLDRLFTSYPADFLESMEIRVESIM